VNHKPESSQAGETSSQNSEYTGGIRQQPDCYIELAELILDGNLYQNLIFS